MSEVMTKVGLASAETNEEAKTPLLAYHPPQLQVYGDVHTLTQGGDNTHSNDSPFSQSF